MNKNLLKLYHFQSIDSFEDIVAKCKIILGKIAHNYHFSFDSHNITYSVDFRSKEDRICFLATYGNQFPNKCYDKIREKYNLTTLNNDVVHVDKQFFFCIMQDGILVSDPLKKNTITNYFMMLDKSFSCRLLASTTDIEEFIKNITSVEKITINATNNLFIKEFLNPSWYSDIGQEYPETSKIEMNFGRVLNEKYIKNIYKKLKDESYIQDFSIEGKNDDGFLSINLKSMIKNTAIELEKRDGYYDIEEFMAKI